MRITWNTPVDDLMHSDNIAYIDLDEDELVHWKYIKREKLSNGKYRYYYDTDQLKSDVKNLVSDPIGAKAKKKYQQAQQEASNAQNAINERLMSDLNYREASKGNGPETTSINNRADRENAVNKYRKDSVDLAVAKGQEKKAKEAYDKTILGKVEKIPDKARSIAEGAKQKVMDSLGQDEKNYRDYIKKLVDEGTEQFSSGESVGEAYVKAQKEYMKTPLGLIEEAGRVGRDWLEKLFGKNRR